MLINFTVLLNFTTFYALKAAVTALFNIQFQFSFSIPMPTKQFEFTRFLLSDHINQSTLALVPPAAGPG